MTLSRAAFLGLAACVLLASASRAHAQNAAATSPPAIWKESIAFKSGDLNLTGYLFRPAGPGPFKGLIWNHGSEKNPGGGSHYDSVAAIFVPAGYVVFAPVRRVHGTSEGAYVVDQTQRERESQGAAAANRLWCTSSNRNSSTINSPGSRS